MNVPQEAPKILGVGHKARMGKDTFADWLVQNCGYHKLHWADALYEECAVCSISVIGDKNGGTVMISCYDESHVWNSKETPNVYRKAFEWALATPADHFEFYARQIDGNIAVRYEGMKKKDGLLLQWWGTDYRRNIFGETYWLDRIEQAIYDINGDGTTPRVVIPDTRFPNEADACREWGGAYCEIWRPEGPTEDTGRDSSHISETALDNYKADFDINSTGTLEEYLTQIAITFNHWRV